jgi:hypothetical protein
MADRPRLIVQVPRGGTVDRQLAAQPPISITSGEVVVVTGPVDAAGRLEPPAAGQVVLSVLSPEVLTRDAEDLRRVLGGAGTGTEPLVVEVEAAEELRDAELDAVLDAARHASRAVILRVIAEA